MGGYGSSDITANIEVNLNNIDRSTQDAATLASQLKDWGTSIEAANKQLQDYTTSQSELLQTSNDLAETHERIVAAARELKEISAQSGVNLRDMAQNAREIQSALSGLGGVGAAPYTPGVSSASPASVVDSGLGYGMGMPGAPESTPADFGMSTGGNSVLDDLISASMTGGGGGGGKATSPVSTKEGVYQAGSIENGSYGESMAKKILGINYFMPGGKLAALGRYVDKISGGKVVGKLGKFVSNNPRIFGTPTQDLNSGGEEAFSNYMAKQGFFNAKGQGISANEANSMFASGAEGMTADVIQGGAVSAAEAGGLGVVAEGGLLSTLGGVAAAAAPVAALAYLGMQGYNAYASYQQQGQVLGSLTGQTGQAGRMVGMEATDFLGTMFNPLLNYGTAKEIQMTGLGAGFQGNPNGVFGGDASSQGLLGQYTGFASNAYQNYGMSPQDSLQMFNSSVIAAGTTAQQLTEALHNLANVSATTNTSFQQLQKNFSNSMNYLGGMGATGASAINLATGMSLANAGNTVADKYLQQQNIGGTGGLLQNEAGIALTAQAAGMSFTQAFGAMATDKGAAQLGVATNTAVLNMLKNSLGLYPGMPGLKKAITDNLYQAYMILSTLLPMGPDGKGAQWTPRAAYDWLMKELSGHGGGESISAGNVVGVTTAMNVLLKGAHNTMDEFNNIFSQVQGTGTHAFASIEENGQLYTTAGIENMSKSKQQKLLSDLIKGKATVGLDKTGIGGTGYNGQLLGSLIGSNGLTSFENNPNSLNQYQIELGPQAAALFKLINNPQQLTNQQIKYLSSMGLNTNTYQSTGWIK